MVVTPYVGIALFVLLIVYHATTSEGLHASPLARLLSRRRRARREPSVG